MNQQEGCVMTVPSMRCRARRGHAFKSDDVLLGSGIFGDDFGHIRP
jgi:hypothetical protein